VDSFQLLVLVGLVVVIIIGAASLIWAFYLDEKLQQKPGSKNYKVKVEGTQVFSDQEMAMIGQKAQADLEAAVAQSSEDLRTMLDVTMKGMNTKVKVMIAETLSKEFQLYHRSLADIREKTLTEFTHLKKQLDSEKQQLLTEFESTIKQEQAAQMDAFNNRLDDVVSSYIAESLEHNVDLGSQMKYILASLESKKDDIKKDVLL
jgi:hypothetical protein